MNRFPLFAAAFFALIPTVSASNTWYVDINGTAPGTGTIADPYTSIQYAAMRPATLDGDTLLVAPGTYPESLHVVTKFVSIKSIAGPELTVIKPGVPGGGVHFDGGFTNPMLDGFTVLGRVSLYDAGIHRCIIRPYDGNPGGGMFIQGSGSVTDSTITGCYMGIALDNFTGTVSLRDSILTGNTFDISATGASHAYWSYCAGITTFNLGGNGQAALHPGLGNVSGDVGFWDPARLDFHLRPGSQCIDSGDPSSPLDPDGSPHDIGALTYDPTYAPAPSVYCTAKTNSQGCVPAIGAIGSASASSGTPFSITAANELANKPGLLLLGLGKVAQPFQGGVLCVQSPIKRVGAQISAGAGVCGGTYSFDMAAYIVSGAHPGLVPGVLVDCQWWSRDVLDPAGFGSALSDAVSFGIAP
ncbi:MAG TPA: hypothetical protein VK843_02640 [Planctomycetota bacterium]|nr:hypothetical protein [Planctomycetota bacterium]